MAHWRDDLVAFVIGCSFSFEEALMADGSASATSRSAATCRCTAPTSPAPRPGRSLGRWWCRCGRSQPAEAIRAVQITTRFPAVHGAPVHFGRPDLIGIKDIAKPDYGDAVTIRDDEVPVFWACGVTPQSVILHSRPDFAITHAPGHMLVTDVRNSTFSSQ